MAGATPKVIDVSQGVEFSAEIAAGAGHARDAAVEAVKQHRESDRLGGVVEMPEFARAWRASLAGSRSNPSAMLAVVKSDGRMYMPFAEPAPRSGADGIH